MVITGALQTAMLFCTLYLIYSLEKPGEIDKADKIPLYSSGKLRFMKSEYSVPVLLSLDSEPIHC